MKRKRHSPEQVIQKLHDADAMLASGKTMGQVCQALEISEQTFHRWRNQYGGMKAGEARRLKELEGASKGVQVLPSSQSDWGSASGKNPARPNDACAQLMNLWESES